jgi:hypothetical protein
MPLTIPSRCTTCRGTFHRIDDDEADAAGVARDSTWCACTVRPLEAALRAAGYAPLLATNTATFVGRCGAHRTFGPLLELDPGRGRARVRWTRWGEAWAVEMYERFVGAQGAAAAGRVVLQPGVLPWYELTLARDADLRAACRALHATGGIAATLDLLRQRRYGAPA